jgi:hypothetical protein
MNLGGRARTAIKGGTLIAQLKSISTRATIINIAIFSELDSVMRLRVLGKV